MLKRPMLSAQLYHILTHNLSFDLKWYHNYISIEDGPILELGVGTGRIVIPLAKKGFSCFGIDNNVDMIDFCTQQLQQENLSVSLHKQEMQHFSFDQQFQQIHIPLRSIQLLSPEDRTSALQSIFHHLKPHGHAILHVSLFTRQQQNTWKLYSTIPSTDGGLIIVDESSTIINNNLHLLHRFQQVSPQHLVTATYILQHILYPVPHLEKEIQNAGLQYSILHQEDSEMFIMAKKQ